MKIQEIYTNFEIPQNLREHMLRVGAFTVIIAETWTGDAIGDRHILVAALLHDIAKPINFDLDKQAQFGMSPPDIKRLALHQEKLKKKYGEDEHQANIEILRDLGCSREVVDLVDNLEWSYIPKLFKKNDLNALILIYSDMRIGISGVLSLGERLSDLKKRSSNEDFKAHSRNGKHLEAKIQENSFLDFVFIDDTLVNSSMSSLIDMEI